MYCQMVSITIPSRYLVLAGCIGPVALTHHPGADRQPAHKAGTIPAGEQIAVKD